MQLQQFPTNHDPSQKGRPDFVCTSTAHSHLQIPPSRQCPSPNPTWQRLQNNPAEWQVGTEEPVVIMWVLPSCESHYLYKNNFKPSSTNINKGTDTPGSSQTVPSLSIPGFHSLCCLSFESESKFFPWSFPLTHSLLLSLTHTHPLILFGISSMGLGTHRNTEVCNSQQVLSPMGGAGWGSHTQIPTLCPTLLLCPFLQGVCASNPFSKGLEQLRGLGTFLPSHGAGLALTGWRQRRRSPGSQR